MTMNGKEDHFIEEDFKKIAESVEVHNWKEIMKGTIEVVKDWPRYAKKADVKKDQLEKIRKSHRVDYDFSKK